MASVSKSPLWKDYQLFKLDKNMRIEQNVPDVTVNEKLVPFRDWVIQIGDGQVPTYVLDNRSDSSWFEIARELFVEANGDGMKKIIEIVYGDLQLHMTNNDYLRDTAILSPMNEDVERINNFILDMLAGETHVYNSFDSVCKASMSNEDQEAVYPAEFLNTLKFNGVPNHEINLKVGAPIILLQNVDPARGLFNGTRLLVKHLTKWVIEAEIITGNKIGEKAFIPRIIMSSNEPSLPFVFKRLQFLIALCYGMSINKSQGQTLKIVGLYLPKPVFTHGQLYVAISSHWTKWLKDCDRRL